MTPFDQMWESSRSNAFSGQTATVNLIAVVAIVLVAILPNRVRVLRWIANLLIICAASWITTGHASREIEEKWRIRYEYVKAHEAELTDDERFAVTVDGANRLIGPLIHGAFVTTKQCGLVIVAIFCLRFLILKLRHSHSSAIQCLYRSSYESNAP